MWKVVTFLAVVTTMAVLGLLIFLLEKAKTGEEWAVMAMWFRLCDWLMPTARGQTDLMTISGYQNLEPVGKAREQAAI
jgi:hypothetical protein